ncbi:hypothetical protein [Parabacteroides pacaensis]|uniref:hypothetical protein n=1 Tax=Parabacteroides pacaensis TaxID=2086575 RepID=UPI000D0E7EF9|nr:hypothetical protein [Parabacteroides pacaensis]
MEKEDIQLPLSERYKHMATLLAGLRKHIKNLNKEFVQTYPEAAKFCVISEAEGDLNDTINSICEIVGLALRHEFEKEL